jgi:tetratricopeptide (TPR) repeat protein
VAALAAGTMRAPEMLAASAKVMAIAPGAQWSRAAAHHGRALYALGHLSEAFAMFEEAWHRADRLDDPFTGAIAAHMGAACYFLLYDYAQSERWCRRELERRRSRLSASLRFMLSDLLAASCVAQGNLPEAREVLSEWEGAESRHWLLAYHEGDWERCVILLRKEFDGSRAAGKLSEVAAFGAVLGRVARIGNQRVQAEAILDESLQASLTSVDLPVELFIRLELAIIHSDLGQFRRAWEELRRCEEILDNGENWRGIGAPFCIPSPW